MRLAVVLFCALAMFGCGGGDAGEEDRRTKIGVDAGDLETELPRTIHDQYRGDRFSSVKCVERGEYVFRCVGEYTPSRASIEREMRSIDTSNFAERDWQVLIDGRSGSVSYEVTVDPSDGSFIFEPN